MQEPFDFLISKEPVFKQIVSLYGFPVVPSRPQGFETLVLLILEQQVSIESAKAAFLKLRSTVIEIIPEHLYHLSDEAFRKAGISRQKTVYIRGLSKAILYDEINLTELAKCHPDLVRNELLQIKGIGHWTIDVYLMFSLKAPDVLPLGDIALFNTIKELFAVHTKEEMTRYAESWKPFRSHATFLLWHYYLNKRNRKITYNYE